MGACKTSSARKRCLTATGWAHVLPAAQYKLFFHSSRTLRRAYNLTRNCLSRGRRRKTTAFGLVEARGARELRKLSYGNTHKNLLHRPLAYLKHASVTAKEALATRVTRLELRSSLTPADGRRRPAKKVCRVSTEEARERHGFVRARACCRSPPCAAYHVAGARRRFGGAPNSTKRKDAPNSERTG